MIPRGDAPIDRLSIYRKSRRATVVADARRGALCLSALFTVQFILNIPYYLGPLLREMLFIDPALIVFFALFGFFARPERLGRLPPESLSATLALLTGTDILVSAFLLGTETELASAQLFTIWLGLTIIGTATVMLSFRWFAGTGAALILAWWLVIGQKTPFELLVDDIFILIATATVALLLLANRIRSFTRLQHMRVYSAAMFGQRTPQGVGMTFGRFTALMTESAQWSIQWMGPTTGGMWVDGQGALSRRNGIHEAVGLSSVAAALAVGRPFAWDPSRRKPADPESLRSHAVLAVPLMSKKGVQGVLWLAKRGLRRFSVAQRDLAATCASQARAALESVGLLEEVQALAITDELTGLFNRRQFFFLAERENARRRGPGPGGVAVVMADIDHFKKVNDTHGHGVGDIVLKEVARRLKNGLRLTDVVGRYGGEEFAVLLPDTSPKRPARWSSACATPWPRPPIEAEGRS
ncbi:MAG: diguanylate cyclase [Elusimicrobia bacterium]|nr:diguanylate cyclase [Elusimicrobiota bacterium]